MLNANLIRRLTTLEADQVSCWSRTTDGLKLDRLPKTVVVDALIEVGRYNPAQCQPYFRRGKPFMCPPDMTGPVERKTPSLRDLFPEVCQ